MSRTGQCLIVVALICGVVWGVMFAVGTAFLVWREEPYAGTDYRVRCHYMAATGPVHAERTFRTLADMQRFSCPGWRSSTVL